MHDNPLAFLTTAPAQSLIEGTGPFLQPLDRRTATTYLQQVGCRLLQLATSAPGRWRGTSTAAGRADRSSPVPCELQLDGWQLQEDSLGRLHLQ